MSQKKNCTLKVNNEVSFPVSSQKNKQQQQKRLIKYLSLCGLGQCVTTPSLPAELAVFPAPGHMCWAPLCWSLLPARRLNHRDGCPEHTGPLLAWLRSPGCLTQHSSACGSPSGPSPSSNRAGSSVPLKPLWPHLTPASCPGPHFSKPQRVWGAQGRQIGGRVTALGG